MKIIQTTVEAMGDVYPQLYEDVFGILEWHHRPDVVYLFTEDDDSDVIGFASGFQTKQSEIYLQWGGERKKYRGPGSLGRLKQLRDYLHLTFKYIITTVETKNLNMLRLYLKLGYEPYGFKVATDGTKYLELMHGDD